MPDSTARLLRRLAYILPCLARFAPKTAPKKLLEQQLVKFMRSPCCRQVVRTTPTYFDAESTNTKTSACSTSKPVRSMLLIAPSTTSRRFELVVEYPSRLSTVLTISS